MTSDALVPPACAPPLLDRWGSAAAVAPSVLPECRSLLVVAAHPDDETLGAGRLLAGSPVPARALTLTAGEACFDGTRENRSEVGGLRLAEWERALEELGVDPLGCGGLPDGRLGDHLVDAVAVIAAHAEPGTMLLAPWPHDPHPDHGAAGRAAVAVADRLGIPLLHYLVWAPYWLEPEDVAALGDTLHMVPSGEDDERRWHRALDCFTSQLQPWRAGWPPVVPRQLLERHRVQWVVHRG